MEAIMDATHIHLILNHVPMLAIVIAGALFGIALAYRNIQFQRVALGFLVVVALTAIPVYLTGEPAEETVERAPGVSEQTIDRHEKAAGAALAAMEALGGLALLGMLIFRKAAALPKVFAAGVLVLALAVSGLFGWTGYLGGQIHHPELRAAAQISGPAQLDVSGERGRSGHARSEKSARAGDDN
jgi:uncharacterized membrane protein